MRASLRATLLAAALLPCSACSTKYQPRTPGRVTIVMEGGQPAYHKDGTTYGHGLAGGGLVDAVDDDPEAREAAETYNTRMTTGLALTLVGTACLVASTSLLAVAAVESDDGELDDSHRAWLLGTAACALGGVIGGSMTIASGMPYQYDAINIYNDNARARERRPPYWVPTGYPVVPSASPQPPAGVAPPPAAPPKAPAP